MDRKQETKAVKDALATAGINAVVGHGRGTAWGWLEINVGSGEQFTHKLTSPCECDRCQEAGRKIWAIHDRALRIAKDVTGRHGEYDGEIIVLTQKNWDRKLARSVEILQKGGHEHPDEPAPDPKTAITKTVGKLIQDAGINQYFPDIAAKPLDWQIATVGIFAACAGETEVANACDSMLNLLKG